MNHPENALNESTVDKPSPLPVQQLSFYIPMADNIKIAVEVWLPETFRSGDKVPVAIEFTRYWRVAEGHPPHSRIAALRRSGIAVAIVDCRGTGASFGCRKYEQADTEVADFAPVIDWVSKQSWSNGSVVGIGVSFCANTAEYTLFNAPSALKAAIPLYSDFDLYTIGFPGGLLNSGMLKPLGDGVRAMDLNDTADVDVLWEDYRHKSIKPVDGDSDKSLLKKALQQHQHNASFDEILATIEYRDDFHFIDRLENSDRPLSPHLLQGNPRLSELPSYHWASFTDAGTAAGAIARFVGSAAPMRVVIGYWTHGTEFGTNPFQPIGLDAQPSVEKQYRHIADYIHALCDNEKSTACSKLSTERALYYYTAGQECWKKTQAWPPQGITTQSWYFAENNTLQLEPPKLKKGHDTYQVDFDAGTGPCNRWDQIVKEVYYGDRSGPDQQCLTYTSVPLEQAVEITGHPVVYLQLSSTRSDGALNVYLESVAPDGTVTMLTEGNLRVIHRKVSSETPPYQHYGPYHSFERKDALAMPIGERVEIGFECLPLSVQLPKGHAIKVAIAGHDKDCFDRLPTEGDVTLNLFRQAGALSFIDIPIRYIDDLSGERRSEPVDPFMI